MLKVLDTFAGIGGFSLGLERTGGFKTVAFCEIEPFCQKVLRKHWLEIPIYDDVRTLTAERLKADRIAVDVITGGFPCQDISVAGRQAGIEGERSGLWSECVRLLSELCPHYAIYENVSGLLSGGNGQWFGKVLADMASIGYDAEWHCIPASCFEALHRRERIWIIAYSSQNGWLHNSSIFSEISDKVTDTGPPAQVMGVFNSQWLFTNGDLRDIRKDHGISNAMDRIGACGNAIVPQIPELIGRAILEYERKCRV